MNRLGAARHPDATNATPGTAMLVRPKAVAGAASMLAAARWWPRYRRPAPAGSAVAAGSAVVGGLIKRRSSLRPA